VITRGTGQSLGLYQLVFSDGDLRIRGEDQVSEGERVASRWVAEGHDRGRAIRIWGIVISRVEDDEIVEDWAASDNFHLIRQLGPWRLAARPCLGARTDGISSITHSLEAAVSAATSAMAPPWRTSPQATRCSTSAVAPAWTVSSPRSQPAPTVV